MNLLISACLLGICCRYDGKGIPAEGIGELLRKHTCIPVCPEQLGGLPTPREPAERQGTQIVTQGGKDVTEAFRRGAQETLQLAKLYRCEGAVLKEKSPSCGCGRIYSGEFNGTLIEGSGITAELLQNNGLFIVGESQIEKL